MFRCKAEQILLNERAEYKVGDIVVYYSYYCGFRMKRHRGSIMARRLTKEGAVQYKVNGNWRSEIVDVMVSLPKKELTFFQDQVKKSTKRSKRKART